MTPTSRIDAIARGLAVRSAPNDPLERIARAMATPISRRRAFRLAAAAGTSLFVIRTDTAQACATCPQPLDSPDRTKFCGFAPTPGTCLFACCPPDRICCRAPKGVICCKMEDGYECGPPIDGDLPWCKCIRDLCNGRCCRATEECILTDLATGQEACVPYCRAGEFRCFGHHHCCNWDQQCCGRGCCPHPTTCCDNSDTDSQTCCGRGYTCSSTEGLADCRCALGLACGGQCCPPGQICASGRCRGPQWEDLEKVLDSLRSAISSAGAEAGGAGGASARSVRRAAARTAAAPGASDALVAIGAVANMGALAYERFFHSRPESAYRRSVKAREPRLRPLLPGPGLDASAAKALHRLLSAEARAWALLNAAGTAQGRSLGAIRAKDLEAARRQARAYGHLAGQAGKALRRVPPLRAAAVAALQAGGAPEVTVTPAQAQAFQDSVRAGGLPSELRARLTQLGVGRADQKRLRKVILARGTVGGPMLIAPLANASGVTAVKDLRQVLRRIAARSRSTPLVSAKARPRVVDGVRPHASQGSGRRRR